MTDSDIREQSYAYFLQEAPELLQVLEQELLNLRAGYSITKVHTLMRATHTLKGAAASVGLESIKTVAHSLEDIFKTLCKPDVAIDSEIEALLFEGYECLRAPLMAELTGNYGNNAEIFDRAAAVFTQLQERLGDCFDQEAYIPTSTELGFDMTQSIFEVGVTQRLEELAQVLTTGQPQAVASTLQTQAEVFLGLAESLNLPGFGAIATAAIAALAKHPDQAVTIAQLALADLQHGQASVLSGDRTVGGQPCLDLQQLADLGEVGETEGEETDLEALWNMFDASDVMDESEVEFQLETTSSTIDAVAITSSVQSAFVEEDAIAQSSPPNQIPKKTSDSLSQTVRVNVEHLDRLNYLIGELLTHQNHQSLQTEQVQGEMQTFLSQLQQHQQMLQVLQDWSEQKLSGYEYQEILTQRHSYSDAQFDPTQDEQSQLHQIVQSLLASAGQLAAATHSIDLFSRQSSEILEKQHRLLTSARDDLLAARMMPIGDIFNRLPPVLQQLETLHNKPVALKLGGTDILVDKAVAEKLYNPLLHLVRNAFDHGIEPVEVRQQRSKPQTGQIEIAAFHQGSHLMVQIRDDGQGLKFAQIRQRAVELNLISPEQASHLNEAQLMDLLFESGFSTAEQVNNLSGRGIGLDVVRAQLQALQGAVSVYSEPYQGTTFLLQIPFSLKIAKLFLCQAGSTVYAFLTDAIEQILIPHPQQIRQRAGSKVLQWGTDTNERLIPVCQLQQILNYCSPVTAPLVSAQPHQERVMPIILLRHQEQLLGVEIEQMLGEQELVIRPLGAMIMPPRYVYGASILADGRLTLVIDGTALARSVINRYKDNAQWGLAPSVQADGTLISSTPSLLASDGQRSQFSASSDLGNQSYADKTLLLVDDSITLRQNLALTLQKFGYQVLQAQDGYEAIEQLRSHPHIQLTICDLEMPRMSGFEFLHYRRQDSSLAQIPVVILTSQIGEKHRLMAMELGATAYINKPYLEQQLIATITGLLQQNNQSFVNS